MCEPTTLAIASMGVTATGAGASIYANVQAEKAQASVDAVNRQMMSTYAGRVRQYGVEAASDVQAEGRRVAGAALAATAANGVETSVGSPANMFDVSYMNAAQDAARIRAKTEEEALNIEREIANNRMNAALRRRATILGSIGQGLGAAGSILGTGASAFKYRAGSAEPAPTPAPAEIFSL